MADPKAIAEAAERLKDSAEAWLGEIDPLVGSEHEQHWRDELAVADALLAMLSRERSAAEAMRAEIYNSILLAIIDGYDHFVDNNYGSRTAMEKVSSEMANKRADELMAELETP